MELHYKYTLADFEVIKQNKLVGYTAANLYDASKTSHKVEYEIYKVSEYFRVGSFFGLFKGKLFRGAPQVRLRSIALVNSWLERETGTNPELTDEKEIK